MNSDRPKRKAIPVALKLAICARQNWICTCGCGRRMAWQKHRAITRYDHTPALELRIVNDAGTDYVPPQLDPDYIVARCLESDEKRRSGGPQRATTAGRDTNAMAKQRRRDRALAASVVDTFIPIAKTFWPKRAMAKQSDPWGKKRRAKK